MRIFGPFPLGYLGTQHFHAGIIIDLWSKSEGNRWIGPSILKGLKCTGLYANLCRPFSGASMKIQGNRSLSVNPGIADGHAVTNLFSRSL